MKKFIMIFQVILSLVACSQPSPTEKQAPHNPLPRETEIVTSNVSNPEKEPFEATISISNQVQSNEEFIVEATLKNLSDHEYAILHAAGLFYFSILDSNGKGVNTFVMPEVGIMRTLQGNGTITERYTYKLKKPDIYEVSAKAKFSKRDGDNENDLEIETNKAKFEVIPSQ